MKRIESAGLWILIFFGILIVDPFIVDPIFIPKQLIMSAGILILWISLVNRLEVRTKLSIPAMIFFFSAAISTMGSRDMATSIFGLYEQPFHGLVQIAILIMAFFASASAEGSVIVPLLWTSSILSLVAIAQAGGLIPAPFSTMGDGRVTSLMGSPVFFGAVISAMIPICAWAAIRKIGILPLLIACVACYLTRSRSAYLASFAGLGVLFLGIRGRNINRAVWASLALSLALLWMAWPAGRKKSDEMRKALWIDTISAISKAPAIGHGPDTFPSAFRESRSERFVRAARTDREIQGSAHNDILQVAVTMGALGLAAYLLGICAIASIGWGLAFSVLTALFVMSKFQPIPPQALLILAVIAGQSVKIFPMDPLARRRVWLPGFATALIIFIASFSLWRADGQFRAGLELAQAGRMDLAAGPMRKANEIFPWNIIYAARRCEVIWRLLPYAGPGRREEWVRRALKISSDNERWHPGDPVAHELASTANLVAGKELDPSFLEEAARQAKIAREMSPLFEFSWRRTLEIARMMGDEKLEKEAESEIEKISLAIKGGPL